MHFNIDELDRIVRFVLFALVWAVPNQWQRLLFPVGMRCYIKIELPRNLGGSLDLNSLERLNWGFLPIDDLWPIIRDDPVVGLMLQEHCSEFSINQIISIAQSDPENRAQLLQNDSCMKQINWGLLELSDYQNYLPELAIHSIISEVLPAEIILHGLIKCNFRFPSTAILCEFLQKFPLCHLDDLGSFPEAIELFNANCFLSYDICGIPKKNLLPRLISFLLNSSFRQNPRWPFKVAELKDFLETFLPKVKISSDLISHAELVHSPLQRRSLYLNINGDLDFEIEGLFDQFRLLLILLPDKFDLFMKLWDDGMFDPWLLDKFMEMNPEIKAFLHENKHMDLKLLRALSLRREVHTSKLPPQLVSKPQNIKDFRTLRHEIIDFFLKDSTIKAFSQKTFSIKFADDAVVDMGGPLLDWISGILQLLIQFNVFQSPQDDEFEADSGNFVSPDIFKFIGLLQGKLLQLNSGPPWIPRISDNQLKALQDLRSILHSHPEEAIKLFNDFEFPDFPLYGIFSNNINIKSAPAIPSSIPEVSHYISAFEDRFVEWKSRALQEYSAGLEIFLLPKIPESTRKLLLLPPFQLSAEAMAAESTIHFSNHQTLVVLNRIWTRVLFGFTRMELEKLLIFATGQTRIRHLRVHFLEIPGGSPRRLPHSKTFTNDLFLYISLQDSEDQCVEAVSRDLRFSILNYLGFGNV